DSASIEPMLYVIAFYDEARLVPMIERQHDPGRCAVERVRGRGGREATAAVRRVLVIEELIFRAAPVDMIVLACAAVKDTAAANSAAPQESATMVAYRGILFMVHTCLGSPVTAGSTS